MLPQDMEHLVRNFVLHHKTGFLIESWWNRYSLIPFLKHLRTSRKRLQYVCKKKLRMKVCLWISTKWPFQNSASSHAHNHCKVLRIRLLRYSLHLLLNMRPNEPLQCRQILYAKLLVLFVAAFAKGIGGKTEAHHDSFFPAVHWTLLLQRWWLTRIEICSTNPRACLI